MLILPQVLGSMSEPWIVWGEQLGHFCRLLHLLLDKGGRAAFVNTYLLACGWWALICLIVLICRRLHLQVHVLSGQTELRFPDQILFSSADASNSSSHAIGFQEWGGQGI
jgi:hypothetical protein